MNTKQNGLDIRPPIEKQHQEPKFIIYVDASDTGWGITSQLVSTHGFWNQEEKEHSINVRKLKTILFALRLHKNESKGNIFTPLFAVHTQLPLANKFSLTASKRDADAARTAGRCSGEMRSTGVVLWMVDATMREEFSTFSIGLMLS